MSDAFTTYFNQHKHKYPNLYTQKAGILNMQGASMPIDPKVIREHVNKEIRPQMNIINGKPELSDRRCAGECEKCVEYYVAINNSRWCLECVYLEYVKKVMSNVTLVKFTFIGKPEDQDEPIKYCDPDEGIKMTFGEEGEWYINGKRIEGAYSYIHPELKNKDPYQFNTERAKRKPVIEITITTPFQKQDAYFMGSCNGFMQGQVCQSLRMGVPCMSMEGNVLELRDTALPGFKGLGAPCIRHGNVAVRDTCHECYNNARKIGCVTINSQSAKSKKKTARPKNKVHSPRGNNNSDARKAIARLTKERDELIAMMDSLKKENEELRETVDSYGSVIDIDRKRIERLQNDNRCKDVEIARLKAENIDLKLK